jgi:hypothetical protein
VEPPVVAPALVAGLDDDVDPGHGQFGVGGIASLVRYRSSRTTCGTASVYQSQSPRTFQAQDSSSAPRVIDHAVRFDRVLAVVRAGLGSMVMGLVLLMLLLPLLSFGCTIARQRFWLEH